MSLERYLQGRKLERDVLLDTLEEPRTWTSKQNYLKERNFSRFLSLNWRQYKISRASGVAWGKTEYPSRFLTLRDCRWYQTQYGRRPYGFEFKVSWGVGCLGHNTSFPLGNGSYEVISFGRGAPKSTTQGVILTTLPFATFQLFNSICIDEYRWREQVIPHRMMVALL